MCDVVRCSASFVVVVLLLFLSNWGTGKDDLERGGAYCGEVAGLLRSIDVCYCRIIGIHNNYIITTPRSLLNIKRGRLMKRRNRSRRRMIKCSLVIYIYIVVMLEDVEGVVQL